MEEKKARRLVFNCNEESKCLGSSKPKDHTIFAFNASLGSALSAIMALKAKIPMRFSFYSSLRL